MQVQQFDLLLSGHLHINRYPLHYVFPPPSCLTVRAASVPSVRPSVRLSVSETEIVGEVSRRFTSLLEAFSPGAPLFSPLSPVGRAVADGRSDPRICKATRTELRIVGGRESSTFVHLLDSWTPTCSKCRASLGTL